MLRGALVVVMQAAEDGDRVDSPEPLPLRRSSGWRVGGPLVQGLMGPGPIEEVRILPQHASQMPLTEDRHMVEAFPPHAPEEPLAGGVLPRRAIGRPQLRDAHGRGDAGE